MQRVHGQEDQSADIERDADRPLAVAVSAGDVVFGQALAAEKVIDAEERVAKRQEQRVIYAGPADEFRQMLVNEREHYRGVAAYVERPEEEDYCEYGTYQTADKSRSLLFRV